MLDFAENCKTTGPSNCLHDLNEHKHTTYFYRKEIVDDEIS